VLVIGDCSFLHMFAIEPEEGFMGESKRLPASCREEGIARAAEMADRFHRMLMRTLRALRDLRRFSPSVSIWNAGQVNIGEKQMNLSRSEMQAFPFTPQVLKLTETPRTLYECAKR